MTSNLSYKSKKIDLKVQFEKPQFEKTKTFLQRYSPLLHRIRTEVVRQRMVLVIRASHGKPSKFLAPPGWKKILFGGAFEYQKYDRWAHVVRRHRALNRRR